VLELGERREVGGAAIQIDAALHRFDHGREHGEMLVAFSV
jgi:hypothetical protein